MLNPHDAELRPETEDSIDSGGIFNTAYRNTLKNLIHL